MSGMVKVYSPSVESFIEESQTEMAHTIMPPNPSKEIIAVAVAVFDAVKPNVYDSHKRLTAQMAIEYGSNLWLIPAQERMPFPDAIIYALASMMKTENAQKRRADWFVWLEDDISLPQNAFGVLRSAANPVSAPFVAAVGYDRHPPFVPAVWDVDPKTRELIQWKDVPPGGVHRVAATGLVFAIFHRSLFDKISQPWFTTSDRVVDFNTKNIVTGGYKPDTWWSRRLREYDIPIYVHCGVKTTHHGSSVPVNYHTAPVLRQVSFFGDAEKYANIRRT